MMKIEQMLTKSNIDFKLLDAEDNYKLLKVGNKINLLQLTSKDDTFLLSRDLFDYLDGNKLSYAILLLNKSKEKWYYLKLRKENNWIKSSFATCDKEDIYLGKQVLNSVVAEAEICKKIEKTK